MRSLRRWGLWGWDWQTPGFPTSLFFQWNRLVFQGQGKLMSLALSTHTSDTLSTELKGMTAHDRGTQASGPVVNTGFTYPTETMREAGCF